MDSVTITELETSSTDCYTVTVASALTHDQLLAEFIDADLLRQWWGGALTPNVHSGGIYQVGFIQVDATLEGRILELSTDNLVFTWEWRSEIDHDPTVVHIHTVASGDIATVRVTHTGYSGIADSRRSSHREGWRWALPRLAQHILDR